MPTVPIATAISTPPIEILVESNVLTEQSNNPLSTPTSSATQEFAELNGKVTLWHVYGDGSLQREALDQVIANAREAFPNLQIEVLQIPKSEANRMVQVEFPERNGPDLILAGNVDLNSWIQRGLVLNLEDYLGERTEKFNSLALAGMEENGEQYGLPLSIDFPVLYYHNSTLEKPPQTTEELLSQVERGISLVLLIDLYDLYGWSAAFGGKLFNEAGQCIADQGGWSDYLNYLLLLKDAGAVFETDYYLAQEKFLEGEADIFLDNVSELTNYREIIGDDLGVAPLPVGPVGPALPWVNLDGVYVNTYGKDIPAAVELALYLTNHESAQIFANIARRIPVRSDIVLDDPVLERLLDSIGQGEPMPQGEVWTNTWIVFGELINQVLEGQLSAQEALVQACVRLNSKVPQFPVSP